MELNSSYPFEYWIGGLVGTCELIASTDAFRRVWIQHDAIITSAYCYDELMEQLLGDLNLTEHIVLFEVALKRIEAFDSISAFCSEVLALERYVNERAELRNPETLLASHQWAALQSTALSVISMPAATAYRSARSDISIPRDPSRA